MAQLAGRMSEVIGGESESHKPEKGEDYVERHQAAGKLANHEGREKEYGG